jgi:hypothetical protein
VSRQYSIGTALIVGALSCVVSLWCAAQSADDNRYDQSPKMRPVDRDWDYFKAIACDDLAKVVFHSRSEEILLAKRKAQCVDKYKAFLPKPVKP